MKVEDIIKGFNLYIEHIRKTNSIKTKGHVVLKKEIVANKSFKAYKTYRYTLYYVSSKPYTLLVIEDTSKVLEGQEDIKERTMGIKLIQEILSLVNSDIINQLIQDTYALDRI